MHLKSPVHFSFFLYFLTTNVYLETIVRAVMTSLLYFCYQFVFAILITFLLSWLSLYLCYLCFTFVIDTRFGLFLLLLSITDNSYVGLVMYKRLIVTVDTVVYLCQITIFVLDTRYLEERLFYSSVKL